MQQDEVRYEGWITKMGSFIKSWKKRWFVLYDDHIDYFEKKGNNLKGTIKFTGQEYAVADDSNKPNNFKIITKKRTFQCVTDNKCVANEWINRINCAVVDAVLSRDTNNFENLPKLLQMLVPERLATICSANY